ncbi:MAG TPA: HNH endonuclease, partial [Ktedonobacteraceae bacterium]
NVIYNPGDPFFTAEVSTIDCENQTIKAEQIPALKRMAEIKKIWEQRTFFPRDIMNLLNQHETYVKAKSPIPKSANSLVLQLQDLMEKYSSELEVPYTSTTDVVPALLSALGEVVEAMPVSLEQIEPEQIELRRRERIRWQVWARRRGAASVKFRKEIRTAYNQRCVMCGGRFPTSDCNEKPGVDAAHILPWAEYDLDKVYNGVALCKQHHWAFDEGILLIVFRDGSYYTVLSERALSVLSEPDFSIDILRQVVGEIPKKYLPPQSVDWPNPGLLARRNEEFTD